MSVQEVPDTGRHMTSARMHTHKDASWEKNAHHAKEIMKISQNIEHLYTDLVKELNRLDERLLQAYKETPEVDCLFYDSPISPAKVVFYMKLALKKAGWSGVRDIWVESAKLKTFTEYMSEACAWLSKFKPKEVAQQTTFNSSKKARG